MLLWNKASGGHDIRIGGKIVHGIKAIDFDAAVGSIPQKEKVMAAAIDSKITKVDNRMKVTIKIRSLTPLRYTLHCGPIYPFIDENIDDQNIQRKI